ncbi:M50 family metallopeptidase [Natronomonas sp. LN261]|uniref:M50 family metallopeptidase n=1 Tax=Natronomonas sp. LN261 TaxID=2750669 RepID=UPI0015EF844B|nr:M50 family metallopeptidase [Natronomonas sp. LN261]
MTGGYDLDPEGEPTETACSRCGEPLHTTPTISRDVLACTACPYHELVPDRYPISRLQRTARWVKRRLWPHTTAAGVGVFVLGSVLASVLFTLGALSTVGAGVGAGVAAYVGYLCSRWSPTSRCRSCGIAPTDAEAGFCANCGASLAAPWTDVDPDAVGVLEAHPLRDRFAPPAWLTLPDGVERNGIGIEVTATPTALVDRLLVGPTRYWRGLFTVGIVVAAVGQALLVGFLASVAVDVLGALAAPTAGASASGESGPDPLALPALDAELLTTVAAGVAIGVAVLFVSIALHELGHAMATRANGVELSEVSMSFMAGLLPMGGHMEDYDGRGDVTALDRARTAAAGPLFSLLAGLVVAGPLLATGMLSPGLSGSSLSTAGLGGVVFVYLNVVSFFGNLLPAFGADGDHLVDALGEWLADSRSTAAGDHPVATDRVEGSD